MRGGSGRTGRGGQPESEGGKEGETYSAVGASVLARKNGEKYGFGGEDGRDRIDTTGEGLAKENDVGLDGRVVLKAEELSGAAETLIQHLMSFE